METGKRRRNGYADEAFRGGLASSDSRSRVLEVLENAQSGLVKVAACFSQCNGTRATVDQLRAELLLKGGNMLADSRLADPTFFRDSGEAALLNDPDECLHRIQSVHIASLIPLWNGLYFAGERFIDREAIPVGNGSYSSMCQVSVQG